MKYDHIGIIPRILAMIQASGEQWGRYNLPMYKDIYVYI